MNKLCLPTLEFEDLYIKHLLLKELLNSDVSLYLLSICFIRRKTIACIAFERGYKVVMPLLVDLEDRFINGLIAYKIAHNSYDKNNEFYDRAYEILSNKLKLDNYELFYLALINYNGYGKVSIDKEKAMKLYQLSADQGNVHALINIGCHYRILERYDMATKYFEKAVLMNVALAKSHLAFMLEFHHPINTKKSELLYISAAQQGDEYAIKRCKILDLKY